MVEKNSEAKNTNRNGRKAIFSAPSISICPSTGVSECGISIKLPGSLVTPIGMPTRVAKRIAHRIEPGIFLACRAIARNSPQSATSAPGERKSPSIRALVLALASTSPALRKPNTATNSPMEAVRPSLIDCGTERVTTSRRPNLVSRKNRIPDQQAIPRPICQPMPSLPASVTPTSTEPPMPGPTINGRLA